MAEGKISNLSSFSWSIAEILRGDFKQSEYGKVILPFVVLSRLDCILESTKEAVLAAAESLPGKKFTNRDAFTKVLNKALKAADMKVGAPVKKAILAALSERDEDADVCTDQDGNPEPDSELRDHELVPLSEDWQEYVEREVKPFVPDAWVDTSYTDAQDGEIGRVGYEINFNRYFYKYVPTRPLEEIDSEMKQLEAEIANLLKEVAG